MAHQHKYGILCQAAKSLPWKEKWLKLSFNLPKFEQYIIYKENDLNDS